MGSMNLREDEAYPKNADLLVLPYNGWEDNFPPAARIIERLNPKRIVLTHYDDTFPPVTMPGQAHLKNTGDKGGSVIRIKHGAKASAFI